MKKVNVGQKGWSLPGMKNASPLSAKTFTSPSSLGFPVTQGLADAGHDWDFIRGEIFCQINIFLWEFSHFMNIVECGVFS